MVGNRKRVRRMGAVFALGLLLALAVLAPFGASMAGDGGVGGGVPIRDSTGTGLNSITPDTGAALDTIPLP